MKKRDAKALSKEPKSVGQKLHGSKSLKPIDFEDPKIIHFKTKDIDEKKDEDYKVDWKELEKMVKANFDQLKVVYLRATKYEGDLAISQHELNEE